MRWSRSPSNSPPSARLRERQTGRTGFAVLERALGLLGASVRASQRYALAAADSPIAPEWFEIGR